MSLLACQQEYFLGGRENIRFLLFSSLGFFESYLGTKTLSLADQGKDGNRA